MSPRNYLTHLGLLAGLAVIAPSSATADEGPSGESQIILVHGDSELRVRPDSLSVDVGVEAHAATVEAARGQVAASMRAVVDAVRALGLPDLAIDTRVLSVSPIYASRRPNDPPAIVGYSASNHATVTILAAPVAELGERGSRIVDTAVSAGANSVSGLSFFLADPDPAAAEALAEAVRDAHRDADTIARAAGVTLGELRSIEEGTGMRLVPRAAMLAAVASTPIEIEDIVIEGNVTARYAFR